MLAESSGRAVHSRHRRGGQLDRLTVERDAGAAPSLFADDRAPASTARTRLPALRTVGLTRTDPAEPRVPTSRPDLATPPALRDARRRAPTRDLSGFPRASRMTKRALSPPNLARHRRAGSHGWGTEQGRRRRDSRCLDSPTHVPPRKANAEEAAIWSVSIISGEKQEVGGDEGAAGHPNRTPDYDQRNGAGPESVEPLRRRDRPRRTRGDPSRRRRAASACFVLLAIPYSALDKLPAEALAGRIVVDAMNYFLNRDHNIPELDSIAVDLRRARCAAPRPLPCCRGVRHDAVDRSR